MRLKNAIIQVMGRDDLKRVVGDLELEEVDKRSREEMASMVARKGRAARAKVPTESENDTIQC